MDKNAKKKKGPAAGANPQRSDNKSKSGDVFGTGKGAPPSGGTKSTGKPPRGGRSS